MNVIKTKCECIEITNDTEIKYPCSNCKMDEKDLAACLNLMWREVVNKPINFD